MSFLRRLRRPVYRMVAASFLLAAIAVTTFTVTATGQPGSKDGRSVPACSTGDLVIWLNTNGSGAAGSTYYALYFTNLSGHTCTLRGYPSVSGVGLHGSSLGSPSTHITGHPHTVTLGNVHTATATLQIVDVLNFPIVSCHPVWAAGLKVTPPEQSTSKIVPFVFRACSRSGPRYLHITVVR